MHPLIQYLVFCAVAAIFLWAISKMQSLDSTIVQFMRISIIVVLSIMLLDLVLVLLFSQHLSKYLGG